MGWPAFVASFFSSNGPKDHTRDVLEAWLELVPAGTKIRYARQDDTRRFFEHFDLQPDAVAQVREALSPASILKEEQWCQAYTDTVREACQPFSLEVFASAAGSFFFLTFPLDYVDTRGVAAVVRWFSSWCERFEVTNGAAGFGFELASFHDWGLPVGWEMLATGLRYHGVRVWQRSHARFRESTLQSLDTAAWLTFLDKESISAVGSGGIRQIDPGVLRHSCGSGLVLQAGSKPDPCDVIHRSDAYALLKSVNDAIVPVRTGKWRTNGWSGGVAHAALHGVQALHDLEDSWFSRMDLDEVRGQTAVAKDGQSALAYGAIGLIAVLMCAALIPPAAQVVHGHGLSMSGLVGILQGVGLGLLCLGGSQGARMLQRRREAKRAALAVPSNATEGSAAAKIVVR